MRWPRYSGVRFEKDSAQAAQLAVFARPEVLLSARWIQLKPVQRGRHFALSPARAREAPVSAGFASVPPKERKATPSALHFAQKCWRVGRQPRPKPEWRYWFSFFLTLYPVSIRDRKSSNSIGSACTKERGFTASQGGKHSLAYSSRQNGVNYAYQAKLQLVLHRKHETFDDENAESGSSDKTHQRYRKDQQRPFYANLVPAQ